MVVPIFEKELLVKRESSVCKAALIIGDLFNLLSALPNNNIL